MRRAKDFLASCAALPARRLGVQQELGRDRPQTGDLQWTKGYSRPYGIVLNNKKWRIGGGRRGYSESLMMSPDFLEVAEHVPADGK